MEAAAPLVLIVMGVMGCGKSTVAALLAQVLGAAFYEGDAFHPPVNIAKMTAGTPLCDEDRWPWLQQLADIVQRHLASGQPAVLSCSALKPAYRQLLRTGQQPTGSSWSQSSPGDCDRSSGSMGPSSSRHAAEGGAGLSSGDVGFVLLDPPRTELEQRLLRRSAAGGHFTPGTALLDSQLAALEYEEAELLLHVRGNPFPPAEQVVAAVLQRCRAKGHSANN